MFYKHLKVDFFGEKQNFGFKLVSNCKKWLFFNNRVYFSDKFNVNYKKKNFVFLGAEIKMAFVLPQTTSKKRHDALSISTSAILNKKI